MGLCNPNRSQSLSRNKKGWPGALQLIMRKVSTGASVSEELVGLGGEATGRRPVRARRLRLTVGRPCCWYEVN